MDKASKRFVDAANRVLNSNTFILSFPLNGRDPEIALPAFLTSPEFMDQLLTQDLARGSHGFFHVYDYEKETYAVRTGELVKDQTPITFSAPVVEKREYLIAFLTGDTSKGNFHSYYGTQLDHKDAAQIVDGLILHITRDNPWQLFTLEPDFLTSAPETDTDDNLYYFEQDGANNNAALITLADSAYLILTNGIP